MNRLPLTLFAVLLLSATAACQAGTLRSPIVVGAKPTLTRAAATVTLEGTLRAPAGIIANNTAGLVGNNGSGLIGNNSAGYRLLALEERPLAGAALFLADATGMAIPKIPAVKADVEGRFSFARLPRGFTFLVVASVQTADGRPVRLQTLARSGLKGPADVSVATTFASAVVLGADARTLGDFDPASFAALVETGSRSLSAADVAKLDDLPFMVERMNTLVAENGEAKQALDSLKTAIDKTPTQDLDTQLEAIAKETPASPAPSPSTVPASSAPSEASPSPSPSAIASPTPSSAPTSSPAPSATPYMLQGLVSTLAGSSGTNGFLDGPGSTALFSSLRGLAIDEQGNVYTADLNNHRIRKVTPDGTVSTVAGSVAGYADGPAESAKFDNPMDVAVTPDGSLLVADGFNMRIRKITFGPGGATVSTLAGSTKTTGYLDGPGATAKFGWPISLAVDAAGHAYVAERDNRRIRKVAPDGTVSTFAGSGTEAVKDGVGTAAHFNMPRGLTFDAAGNLYVADHDGRRIRKITPEATVTTIAGTGVSGTSNGSALTATFRGPSGLAVDAAGNLYIADQDGSQIRKLSPDGQVTTLAGGAAGYLDGTDAKFNNPTDLALGPDGRLYVTDQLNCRLRRID